MKLFMSITLAMLFSCVSAYAFWDVKNSDEDVFGNVNVTASSFGDNGNLLRFECGSSSEPFLVFLLRDSSGKIPEIPAKFIHAGPNGEKFEADAVLTSWNDKFVAVKVTDTAILRGVAEHMIVAKKSISIGIFIPNSNYKKADTFSSRGSTAAGKVLLKNCVSPEKETQAVNTANSTDAKSTTEYHYGFAIGVWDACLQKQLPSNTGHILDLISTAVRNSYIPNYNSIDLANKDQGQKDASSYITENNCSKAAQIAIERLPERY